MYKECKTEWLFGLYFLCLALGTMLEKGTPANLLFFGVCLFLECMDRTRPWQIQGIMIPYLLYWSTSLIVTCMAPAIFGRHDFTFAGISGLITTGFCTVLNTWIIARRCKKERMVEVLKVVLVPILFLGLWEYVKQDHPLRAALSLQDPFGLEWVAASYRIRTIFFHPIVYAVFLTFMWAVTLYYPYRHRLLDIGLKVLMILNIYATQSRSSWIAVAVVTIAYLAVRFKDYCIRRKETVVFQKNKWLVGIGVVLVLLAFFVVERDWVAEQSVLIEQRMTGVFETDIEKSAGSIRLANMQNITKSFGENDSIFAAVFGRGARASLQYMQEHPVFGWTEAVDNQYMTTLWNNGLTGIVLLASMIIYVIVVLWRANPKEEQQRMRRAAALAACAVFLAFFFYEGLDDKISVLLLTVCMVFMADREEGLPNSLPAE